MKTFAPALVLALAAAGPALADPPATYPARGASAVQCLDQLGVPRPPRCRSQQASRIRTEPDICLCGPALREVAVPYCAPGEAPAPDSSAANRARRAAADAGTLMTATFEGRRFCRPIGRTS